MRAIILAGGKGTRLRPYTTVIPKPLVPIGDKAILEILIERLKRDGITDLTLCVNHLAQLIIAYFGDGSRWGVNIGYSVEDRFLSTVAPLRLIGDLPDNFLVMNGDLLTDLSFTEFYDYHIRGGALLTVAVYRREYRVDFGVIDVDPQKGVAAGFCEKPSQKVHVSMGVYAFNRRVLEHVPDGQPFGFDHLMLTLLDKREPIKVYCYDGYWLDIGRPDDYERATEDIARIRS